MSRTFARRFGEAVAPLGLVLLLVLPAAADEDSLRRRVQDLSKITGTDAVRGEIRALKDDPDETKKLIEVALAMAKEKKRALTYNAALVLADVAGQLKDLKSSEIFFRICMDQAVKMESRTMLLETYGSYINFLYKNDKFADSERICQELLELKTGDGKPREVLVIKPTLLGDVDFDLEDNFDTVRGFRSGVHRLLIQAISKQGRHDQALKLVNNLIKAKDHWLERELKGWVLREAGRDADAAKTYLDVLERIAKDKDADKDILEEYEERYRYTLSGIYVDLKQIDKATEQLQILIDKHPDDPGFYNDLGYIWADHDMKLPEAEKLIRKALELDAKRRKANPDLNPEDDHDNGAYVDSLGWVLFKQKKFNEAKEVMLKAVEDKKSQHIEIFDHLGDVHMALGEREAAVSAWKKGLELVGEGRRDQERRAIVEKKLQMHEKR